MDDAEPLGEPTHPLEVVKETPHEIPVNGDPLFAELLDLGNVLCFNIVVLGGLYKILGHEPDIWRDVIKDRVPQKAAVLNLTAYEKGWEIV